MTKNKIPHEWYGPCDAFGPNGECAECARVMLHWFAEKLYKEWLRSDKEKD